MNYVIYNFILDVDLDYFTFTYGIKGVHAKYFYNTESKKEKCGSGIQMHYGT